MAATPPHTPPAIAPIFGGEPLGLGDALDKREWLGSAMLEEADKDEVALEATLKAEDEAATAI